MPIIQVQSIETGGTAMHSKLLYRCLKSRKGGISGLVLEITVTALMLMLIVVVIHLFRSNMEIVGKTAEKTDQVDKVKSEILVPLDKDIVNGGEIISVIRFYQKDSRVKIQVSTGSDSHTYMAEDYNTAVFSIPREMNFLAEYIYTGPDPTRIIYKKI